MSNIRRITFYALRITMTAYIFLNGFYDHQHISFYKNRIESADDETVLICADGGMKIFELINDQFNTQIYPELLLGDLDSVELDDLSGLDIELVPKIDQDRTDGEFAVTYAIENYGCNSIVIFGGLSNARAYNTDHFLGNLKLMRFGFSLCKQKNSGSPQYYAVMCDAFQDIHFIADSIVIERKGKKEDEEAPLNAMCNAHIERVSLCTDYPNTVVASSENLRWEMMDFYVDPNAPNAMRNEFIPDAQTASITLRNDSDPVYLVHNW